jgi:TPR repeat protein
MPALARKLLSSGHGCFLMKRSLPTFILLSFVSFHLQAQGDDAAALRQWQADAAQGNPHAQYNVGMAYAEGRGAAQDFSKAAEFYTKAAEQGNVNAQYNLGTLYFNGKGVQKDSAAATKWFQKAAEQGDMNAAHCLADILYDNKNFAEARTWFEKAANAGIADAEFGLGLMYDLGDGVAQDHKEALRWYGKAAEGGSASAVCNIGILYYNGDGVPVDRVLAHQYFLIATQMGETRAKDLIQFTTDKLTHKQLSQAVAQADEWMQIHPMKAEPAPVPMISNGSV